jgi:hypothetical protein
MKGTYRTPSSSSRDDVFGRDLSAIERPHPGSTTTDATVRFGSARADRWLEQAARKLS